MIKPNASQISAFYNEYTIQKEERNIVRYSVTPAPSAQQQHLNPDKESLDDFYYHYVEIDDDDTVTTYNIMRSDDLEVIEENVTYEDVEAFIIGEYEDIKDLSEE